MSKRRPSMYRPFGLNTTAAEQSGSPGVYPVVQNVRTTDGTMGVRLGMARIGIVAPGNDAKIIDADGSDDKATTATVPTDVFPLGLKWTIEFLCQADTLSGNHFIFGSAASSPGVTIKQTSANTIVAVVTDSAAAATTLTSAATAPISTVIAGMLTRDGAALSLYINNAAAVTGTMSATNLLATQAINIFDHANADFYEGRVEFVRAFRTVKTTQADGWQRLANPLAPDVLFDYVTEVDSGTGYVLDRSRYENHLTVAGTPTTTATLLAHPPVPIQALSGMVTKNGARRLIVAARGLVYSGAY